MSSFQDFDGVVSLLKVAEQLLFSFPLPNEVVNKYEFIRNKTFAKCRIPCNSSHIRRLQIEAHSKAEKDSKVINASTFEYKDVDSQNRLQQAGLFIQKLIGLIEKCASMQEFAARLCESMINPTEKTVALPRTTDCPSFDIYESDMEAVIESYKKSVGTSEQILQEKLRQLGDFISSKTVYIKKLESEVLEGSKDLTLTSEDLTTKYRLLQEKCLKERNDYEKRIKELREEVMISKNASLTEARKMQNKEVERIIHERDLYQEEVEHLRLELSNVSESLQREVQSLHEDYEKTVQELTHKLSYQSKELETELQEKIESLEQTLYYREKELIEKNEQLRDEREKMVSELRKDLNFYKNNAEAGENCIEMIRSVAERIYKRYCEKPLETTDLMGTLMGQIEFLDQVIHKQAEDNAWLVDRLSEVNKENEGLRKTLKNVQSQQTLKELDASAIVLKSFEASRNKLKQQLTESTVQFPDTYSKLLHKYSVNN
jgi:hypothetical protein